MRDGDTIDDLLGVARDLAIQKDRLFLGYLIELALAENSNARDPEGFIGYRPDHRGGWEPIVPSTRKP